MVEGIRRRRVILRRAAEGVGRRVIKGRAAEGGPDEDVFEGGVL